MNKEKYHIFEDKGMDIFLSDIKTEPLESEIVFSEEEQKKSHLLLYIASILVIIGIVSSIIFFQNFITNNRELNKKIRVINEKYTYLEEQIGKLDQNSSMIDDLKENCDSLIILTNEFQFYHPSKNDIYSKYWSMSIAYKYLLTWYDESLMSINLNSNLGRIDPLLEMKLKEFNEELPDILELMYCLHDFIVYKQKYPVAPKFSVKPVPNDIIEDLYSKLNRIRDIYNTNKAKIEIDFKILHDEIALVLNSYADEIELWRQFWKLYNTNNEKDKLAILARFPHMNNYLFKKNECNEIRIGLFQNYANAKLDGISNFPESIFGKRNLKIKKYIHSSDMHRDFRNNLLDFLILEGEKISEFAVEKNAELFASEVMGNSTNSDYYFYGKKGRVFSQLTDMKDHKLVIYGDYFSTSYYLAAEFLGKNSIDIDRFFSEIYFVQDHEKLVNLIKNNDDIVVTRESDFGKSKNSHQVFEKLLPIYKIGTSAVGAVISNKETVNEVCKNELYVGMDQTSVDTKLSYWVRANTNFDSSNIFSKRLAPQNLLLVETNPDSIISDILNSLKSEGFTLLNSEKSLTVIKDMGFEADKFLTIIKSESDYLISAMNTSSGKSFRYKLDLDDFGKSNNYSSLINGIIKSIGIDCKIEEISENRIKIDTPFYNLLDQNSVASLYTFDSINSGSSEIGMEKRLLGKCKFLTLGEGYALFEIDNDLELNSITSIYAEVLP
ncbi:MAG: PhnD/SsuA/transferrin family substrate-binding protein [Candidatus Delongbacteria bacterium]|nr:PhnD/SsuA/transferrin family substrate-binding protein [Candidatus Delongbacteria bacterium]MBN2835539.1 PhnD/SsuA/transferrin family substrate-binding protein [Candidatus Delongbacteria bacterium]